MQQPNFIAAYIIDPHAAPEPLLLLLKRSPRTYFPGIWQIVTGKVDSGHTVLQTVKKEVFEETGLEIQDAYNVNITLFYEKMKDQVGFSANFVVYADHRQDITLSANEHSEYCWCPISSAGDLLAFSTQKETLIHIEEYYIKNKPSESSLVTL